jgi:tetratricopeptide (TPR) repeat protein
MHSKALLLLAPLILSACATRALHDRNWVKVQTPHFEIVSSLSDENTTRLALNAELFHATAEYVMGTALPTAAVPTTLYAFDNRAMRRPFAVRGEPSHFLPTQREIAVIFRTGGGWRGDSTMVLRRNYMHFLLQNHGAFGQHLWFDEGFSELMSTVDVRDDHVDFGQLRNDYVHLLRSETWIPIIRILRTQNLEDWGDRRRPLFAAESWALVHWLYFGQKTAGRGRKQLDRYFKALEEGYSYKEAVDDAFGLTVIGLDRAVHKYVRSDRFTAQGLRFGDLRTPGSHELQPMRRHTAFTLLGWVLIELERPDRAQEWFERALERDPNSARAHAGMGASATLRQEWDAALVHLERALELQPNDSLNRLDLGIYYRDRALASEDPAERASLAEKARRQLRMSWQLDDSRPEPYSVYGSTFLIEGEDPSRGVAALERAHRMLPSDQEIDLDLARMYVALGQPVRAKQIALEAYSNTRSKPVREEAERLVNEIDGAREAEQSAPADAETSQP